MVKQVLKNAKVISHLKILQEQYAMCLIDKAANDTACKFKKYYVQLLLKKVYQIWH